MAVLPGRFFCTNPEIACRNGSDCRGVGYDGATITEGDNVARAVKTAGDAEPAGDDAAEKAVVNIYRKKDLIEAVAASSGVKKKTVRPVVEAVLADLGLALARGDALSLPPLGKLAVNRSKEGARADVMILKLRRLKPGAGPAKAGGDGDEADAGDEVHDAAE